jgi:hypothetical protein
VGVFGIGQPAAEALGGWQGRLQVLFLTAVVLGGLIYFVFFYWLPRLRAPRYPECGGYMVEVDRNQVSLPTTDKETGEYSRGVEELLFRCDNGHELREEREYSSLDAWAGQEPEDVYGREELASLLENEAGVGEKEGLFKETAARLRREEAAEQAEQEDDERKN